MNRWVFAFAVTVIGCAASMPRDDHTITADLACEGAIIEMQSRAKPSPQPDGDRCTRCNGRGVLGDASQIRITCTDCGGTGKKPKAAKVVCTTGACPL